MTNFTPGEFDVMRVLWEHDSLKPAEIQRKFPRPIRNAALRSVLLVLMEKGHVTPPKGRESYVYKAKAPKHGALKKMARRLADAFAGGSSVALIAELIKTEKLSEADIHELKRITAEKAREKTSTKREKKT